LPETTYAHAEGLSKKLLELWEQLELEISNLYRLFAQKFPTHNQL
jgi:hypothetical protein